MRKIITWIFGLLVIFFVLIILFIFLLGSSDESLMVKGHFKYIFSIPFPQDGKIDYSNCSSGFGGGGYTCSASMRVPYKTYKILVQKTDENESILNYHQNAEEWHCGLIDDNQTVYFDYINY